MSSNRSAPCSQTGVGGLTGTSSEPGPLGETRIRAALGSHGPVCCSPTPGTSGEKRACAYAESPGASTIFAASASPGRAAAACVDSGDPDASSSWTSGMPVTKQGACPLFVSVNS